mgnify:CR=1 FL=1
MYYIIPLLFTLISAQSPNATMHLFSTTTYPNAKCLDGSPYGLYIKPSPSNASNKAKQSFMVVLNGGGLCTHESDCTSRSKTDLGSSANWSPEFPVDSVAFMSSDNRNPFRDWNVVFAPYCTGDMHSGQRTEATNETFGLYFSGYHNVMASINYLSTNYNLNSTKSTLVWSGGSAGGVGVFSTLDAVASQLPDVRVVGAPVGGFPAEITWSTTKGSTPPSEDVRTSAFAKNNALFDAILPFTCAKTLGASESYKCGVPHIAYQYLQTPTFILEAITDVVITCGFEGMPCKPVWKAFLNPDNWHRWSEYGINATTMFSATVGKSQRDGLFAPSCLLHTGFTLDGPLIDGVNGVQATWNWMYPTNSSSSSIHSTETNNNFHMDVCKSKKYYPPCGKSCPAIKSNTRGTSMTEEKYFH